jgi:hypothetical protein
MPRADRHFLPGYVWHRAHGGNQRTGILIVGHQSLGEASERGE